MLANIYSTIAVAIERKSEKRNDLIEMNKTIVRCNNQTKKR